VTLAAADPGWDLAVAKVEGFLNPPETVVLEGGRTAGAIARERELFDAQPYVVEQRKATSADGTPVPYFLVHRRDLEFNGKSPTLLYGYGGFSISLTPGYAGMFVGGDVLVPWFSAGGTLAVANIRGGGEFGSTWHSSALRERRQRSYDDFLAVAEDLISSKVTSPPYLGLKGESNGGLLVSVAATQRPDLFRAVVAGVPLTDMLRYHTLLAGSSWVPEYGSPDDPAMRPVLASYSPLNNVRSNVAYPEIFYYTSTADDRVHPAHARWMVAKLRALGNPALYFENTEGGHGGAATLGQSARLTAMQAVYLMQKLGLSPLEER
jgi:prolyl oligopeptidase